MEQIREANTLDIFKRQLKTYLFTRAFNIFFSSQKGFTTFSSYIIIFIDLLCIPAKIVFDLHYCLYVTFDLFC